MTKFDPNAAATRGAELLDERIPGWWDSIDLESLALESTCHCVLGQLGTHEVNLDALSWEPQDRTRKWAADGGGWYRPLLSRLGVGTFKYGFNTLGDDDGAYDDLAEAWKLQIEKRRAGAWVWKEGTRQQ